MATKDAHKGSRPAPHPPASLQTGACRATVRGTLRYFTQHPANNVPNAYALALKLHIYRAASIDYRRLYPLTRLISCIVRFKYMTVCESGGGLPGRGQAPPLPCYEE